MNNAIVFHAEMDRSHFASGAEASRKDVGQIGSAVTDLNAKLALLQSEMRRANGGTEAQVTQVRAWKTELKDLSRELRLAQAEVKALDAAGAVGAGKGPVTVTLLDLASRHGQRRAAPAKSSSRDEPEPEPDPKHGHGNKAMMAHSGRAVLEMMMAGQSPLQALQVEAPRLIQAQGGGLGTMLGVGAGLAVLNKLRENLSETITKAHELKMALMEALRGDASAGSADGDTLRQRLRELDAVIEESQPKIKAFDRLWQSVSDRVGNSMTQLGRLMSGHFQEYGDAVMDEGRADAASGQNANLHTEAEQRREKYLEGIVSLEREANELKEKGFQFGQDAVRIAEIEIARRQKLAQIENELGIAQMRTAMDKVRLDPTTSEGNKKAQLAQMQKELDPKLRTAAALQEQANRGFNRQEQEAELKNEADRERLASRRKAAEIEEPDVAGMRDGDKFSVFDSDLHTKAIDKASNELDVAQKYLDVVREANADDRDAVATVEEKAAAWKKVVRNAQDELAAVQATTREMQLQAKGRAGEARIEQTRSDYDRQIKRARAEGRNDDADELEKQKGLAVRQAKADQEFKTAGQKAKERREADRRNRAADRYEQRQKRHGEVEAANDTRGSFDAYFHPRQPDRRVPPTVPQPDRRVDPNAAAGARADAARGGFKGDLATVESLLTQISEKVSFKGKG